MIHFAVPQSHFGQPIKLLNRDLRLQMSWTMSIASVDVPLVDFFCDPAGLREEVNTALVNKRAASTLYFPCRSASRRRSSWLRRPAPAR